MQNAKWIWKYRDFEKYHLKLYCLNREERGKIVPAFYEIHNPAASVRFRKKVFLTKPETISVTSDGNLCMILDNERLNGADSFHIPAGEHLLTAVVGNAKGMCAVLIQGETIVSDESWEADSYDIKWEKVGTSPLLEGSLVKPSDYSLPETPIAPVTDVIADGSRIVDFADEVFVRIEIRDIPENTATNIFYGESLEETYSDRCVIIDKIENQKEAFLPARACRYIRFTGNTNFSLIAKSVALPIVNRASFKSDKMLSDIFDISAKTLYLCSKMFYLDGIKRDRWPWAGDAMLTARMNYYSFYDLDTVKRTLIALAGDETHKNPINNILDYSFFWMIMLDEYYFYSGDIDFIKRNYHVCKNLLNYYISRRDEYGFIPDIKGVWVFIDWHDIEKKGDVCVIQMLYAKSLEIMKRFAEITENSQDIQYYGKLYTDIYAQINKVFWNEEKSAYVSSFKNGIVSDQVRRHQNYLAVLFGIADSKRSKRIIESVCVNSKIPKLTTPFYRMFEYELLFKYGYAEEAIKGIRDYWGGMINLGAKTMWEEFDSDEKGTEHYAMYGEPFDRSLCHAWGACPLYFFGKYVVGISPDSSGYEKFTVKPCLVCGDFSATVPICRGYVSVNKNKNTITVKTDSQGGVLVVGDNKIELPIDKAITIII